MQSRQVISGPAAIIWNGNTYYTEGDITLTPQTENRVIESSWHGPVSTRQTDRAMEVQFTPLGVLGNSISAYIPYSVADLGKMVAPSVDKDVAIVTASGVKITLKAGVITQTPDIHFGVDANPFGQMTITAMGGLAGKAEGANESIYKIGTETLSANLDTSKIYTPGYQLVIGDGLSNEVIIDGEKGFDFTLGLTINPIRVNAYGTINYQIGGIAPALTFKPVGQTEAEMLEMMLLQGSSAGALGSDSNLGLEAVLSPINGQNGIVLTVPNCQITQGSILFGSSALRHDTYTLTPTLSVGSSLFTLSVQDNGDPYQ